MLLTPNFELPKSDFLSSFNVSMPFGCFKSDFIA